MAKQSNSIVPFLFEGETLTRVVVRGGDPWFVASDVARVLGYRDAPNAVRRLQDDEKAYSETSSEGGDQGRLVISESGLYALIFCSRKPSAIKFRKWVTSEVLPTLRKTGSYRPQRRQALSAEERAARAALAARQARVNEMQAATRTLQEIRLIQGVRAASAAAPGLYAPFGINLDAVEPPQGTLPLDDDSNGSMH
jgi:prophage antirepressor-like protein